MFDRGIQSTAHTNASYRNIQITHEINNVPECLHAKKFSVDITT